MDAASPDVIRPSFGISAISMAAETGPIPGMDRRSLAFAAEVSSCALQKSTTKGSFHTASVTCCHTILRRAHISVLACLKSAQFHAETRIEEDPYGKLQKRFRFVNLKLWRCEQADLRTI